MPLVAKSFADIFSFARASKAWDYGADGTLLEHGNDVIRQGYDRLTGAPAGWRLEGSATNGVRNPRAEGAQTAASAPGASVNALVPTHWLYINRNSGLSIDVSPAPVLNGMTGLRLRYYGITSAGGVAAETIEFDSRNVVPAAAGSTIAASFYYRLAAGVFPAASRMYCRFISTTAGGAIVDNTSADPLPVDSTLRRASRVITVGATATTGVHGAHITSFETSTAYDFTIDLYAPQLETNYFASSLILPPVGAPAASTRAADSLVVDGAKFNAIWPERDLRTNNILWSEQLDNAAWTKSNVGFSTNIVAAPNLTTTAEAITPDTTNAGHNINAPGSFTAGQSYTFSVYAKQASYSGLRMAFPLSPFGAGYQANFDLAAGVLLNAANVVANMVPVGNGWYRCSITATATATGTSAVVLFVLQTGDGSQIFAGTGTSGILLWGAQLENAPAQLAPNLLALTLVEALDSMGWTKTGTTVSTNVAVSAAPDGTNTADKLETDGAATIHTAQPASIVATAGAQYTFAVHAKAQETSSFTLIFTGAGSGDRGVTFNLTTGATSSAFGSALTTRATALPNGWWRLEITDTPTSAATYAGRVALPSGAGTAGHGVLVWGATLTQGATAPAYVPLSALVSPYIATTSAPVTRPTTTAKEGFLICDVLFAQPTSNMFPRLVELTDGTLFNRISLSVNGAVNRWEISTGVFGVSTGGTIVFTGTYALPMRVGMKWGAFGLVLCVDGNTPTLLAAPMPPFLDRMTIGNRPDLQRPLNGRVREIYAGAVAPPDAKFIAACTPGANVAQALA